MFKKHLAILLALTMACPAWAIDRNVSGQKVTVTAIDRSTGGPKTGDAANITVYVSKDDGTLTALGDTSATEISSTNAPGSYLFDLTQSETSAIKLLFTGKSSTSNVDVIPQTIYTVPAGFSASVVQTADNNTLLTTLSGRLTSARAGYLDNINNSMLPYLFIGADGSTFAGNPGLGARLDSPTVYGAGAPAVTYYVRTNGSDSNTGSNSTDDAFLTLQKAIDEINNTSPASAKIDFAGEFTISSAIVVPANTWLCGDGSASRNGTSHIIRTGTSGCAVSALDNTFLTGFKITTTSTSAISAPIGYSGSQTAGRNVIAIDVDTVADSDGLLMSRTSSNNGWWRFFNCTFSYKWDGATIVGEGATAIADFYNCTWTQNGASTIGSATDTRAITATGGRLRFFGGSVTATTAVSGRLAYPVYVRGAGTVELYGVSITGPASQPSGGYDIYQTDRAKIYRNGLTHTVSGYQTSGTIVDAELGVDWNRLRNITATKNFTGTTLKNVTDLETQLELSTAGPVLQRTISSNRVLQVKDRGDGTFGVVGQMNVTAGEPKQLWALEFKGTQLAPGQNLYGMSEPELTGDDAADATVGTASGTTYGACLTKAAFEFQVDEEAEADADITVKIRVTFSSAGDGIDVYVPVNVKAAE